MKDNYQAKFRQLRTPFQMNKFLNLYRCYVNGENEPNAEILACESITNHL